MKADIIVVGSINMDLVVRMPRLPVPGETVTGSDFHIVPGGKGANQAVAAARLGGRVAMLGRVGADPFGERLLASMREAGVGTESVRVTGEATTGIALIMLDESAENSIVVAPGANGLCSVNDVESVAALIGDARVLMTQLEIPLDTVSRAIYSARERGATVILDPAPACPLSPEILSKVDIITPNETEASILTGRKVVDVRSARAAALDLMRRGVSRVLVKLGSHGALLAEDGHVEHVEGFRVEAVDTTAAGDAFAGGLAVALVEGRDLRSASVMANAAGALSVTRLGAQTSMPSREELEAFLAERR